MNALSPPEFDPTSIFEFSRYHYGTQMLTAAVAQFNLYGRLAGGPREFDALHGELGLAKRPAHVMFTALRAMRLLAADDAGRIVPTPIAAERLMPGGKVYVGDCLSLTAGDAGVCELVDRLRTNRLKGSDSDSGPAFIYRAGERSAMDREELARHFTLALAAQIVCCDGRTGVAPGVFDVGASAVALAARFTISLRVDNGDVVQARQVAPAC